jgi:mannose-6-phosphate isomerase-like protein (cupin superfamily)
VAVFALEQQLIHLGLGGTALAQPTFTGDMAWYEDYAARSAADGRDGRLVSLHSFSEDWDSWEMHPAGAEVVLCLSGAMVLHQEHPDGSTAQEMLTAGHYAINPPGVWHTADIAAPATALFITAGLDTQHRPR